MARALFVYWKTDPGQAAAAAAALQDWQARLRQEHPALVAALYRRADDAGPMLTLMETYAATGGLDDALQTRVVAEGDALCAPWCTGRRHVEVFEPWPDADARVRLDSVGASGPASDKDAAR